MTKYFNLEKIKSKTLDYIGYLIIFFILFFIGILPVVINFNIEQQLKKQVNEFIQSTPFLVKINSEKIKCTPNMSFQNGLTIDCSIRDVYLSNEPKIFNELSNQMFSPIFFEAKEIKISNINNIKENLEVIQEIVLLNKTNKTKDDITIFNEVKPFFIEIKDMKTNLFKKDNLNRMFFLKGKIKLLFDGELTFDKNSTNLNLINLLYFNNNKILDLFYTIDLNNPLSKYTKIHGLNITLNNIDLLALSEYFSNPEYGKTPIKDKLKKFEHSFENKLLYKTEYEETKRYSNFIYMIYSEAFNNNLYRENILPYFSNAQEFDNIINKLKNEKNDIRTFNLKITCINKDNVSLQEALIQPNFINFINLFEINISSN
jgi:hypothetical protein